MNPTPEMIEAGMNLTLSSVDLPASECLHESDVREIQAAALALLPGEPAVKELADALELELRRLDDIPPSIQSQANIRLINAARALIRSALSSPVGGVEEEPFVLGYDAGLKQGINDVLATTRQAITKSLAVLKLYQAGSMASRDEVEDAINAIELNNLGSPLTPASDIAALREENERLRQNLEKRDKYIVGQGLWDDFVSRLGDE